MDVEAGVEKQEMLSVLVELQGCGRWGLEGVAVMGFEIKDVVCASGQSELISAFAPFEGVISLSAAENVVAFTSFEAIVVFAPQELIVSCAGGE